MSVTLFVSSVASQKLTLLKLHIQFSVSVGFLPVNVKTFVVICMVILVAEVELKIKTILELHSRGNS
jgi:hypothetical protein